MTHPFDSRTFDANTASSGYANTTPIDREPTLPLDGTDFVVVFVGGGQPYFWIGDRAGHFVGTIRAHELLRFVLDNNVTEDVPS